MAGVKGMKGGGGARPGAGRKPKPPVPVAGVGNLPLGAIEDADPLVFLRKVWMGAITASPTQVKAATDALPYMYRKLGETGKKEDRENAAAKAAGKFVPAPRLVSSNG